MYRSRLKGWLKHWDFLILDLVVLQFSFCLAYWIRFGLGNPYATVINRRLVIVFILCQVLVALFTECHKNILHRGYLKEFVWVVKYIVYVTVLVIVCLFGGHLSGVYSRLLVAITAGLFIFLDYGARLCLKVFLRKKSRNKGKNKRSLVIITKEALMDRAVQNITGEGVISDYFVKSVVLLDYPDGYYRQGDGHSIRGYGEKIIQRIRQSWVDEILFVLEDATTVPTELIEAINRMGITVHYNIPMLNMADWEKPVIGKVGRYRVITNSVRFAPAWKLALKRLTDIVGGLVGCLVTGILYLFIAPAIKRKSPGPAFFSQERIGQNGKIFKMYKFRSMYLDAEERRQALMSQNKIESGLIFKIDDDPRIIGSEKKDKNGKPKGIGNFIRNTSLDEFPQFWNVLKGDMSLVGTRPPTKDEWEKYDLHHRIRMSVKPGITGMWQVSGRSEITDFEEIVRLDQEYVNEWGLGLDVKIMLKTVWVVLKRKGAE